MTYQFITFDVENKCRTIWGTFQNDIKKMFLFVSYLLGSTRPEEFYILEIETDKIMKLVEFAERYGITKDDIKNK